MADLIAGTIRVLIVVALLALVAMTLLKPVTTPLLIDAQARPQDRPSLLFVPCPLGQRNIPQLDDRRA